MASKRTLSYFCGKTVEDVLVEISGDFLKDKNITLNDFSKQIEGLKRQLCGVSSPCHDALAQHCLEAADRMTDVLSSDSTELTSRSQFVIQQLVSMVTHLKMRDLDLTGWSKPVEEVLLNFLWRMTHLETFYCFEIGSINFEPRLVESLPFLINLTHFMSNACNDKIIAALCENCPHLTHVSTRLDSPEVTDKSIDSLILCKKLENVNLIITGVTYAGLVKLLLKSQSKNLKYINAHDPFSGDFLEVLATEAATLETFQLRSFTSSNINARQLPLICKYFPNLEYLNLVCDPAEWPDFSCLDCLEKIETFELWVCQPLDHIEQLYSLRSQVLTYLDFLALQISTTGLIDIGAHCPNLTSLSLRQCSLLKDKDSSTTSTLGKPFEKLSSFHYYSNFSAAGVELILMHAINIRTIRLSASSGLTDVFLTKIFKFNQLKELEKLRISSKNNVSVTMLKSIILRCEKVKYLGKFAPSDDSDAATKDAFKSLQEYITENGYNVKLQ